MKNKINISWDKGMAFETELNGHKLIIDADEKSGGNDRGPRPKALMMLALAGCTGMDVISILKKMRVDIENFNVKIEGDVTEEPPKHYYKMHIIYEFTGKSLPIEKLKKAVNLSKERYCGVSANYSKAMELSSEIIIIEK
ncbi:MAG: OsmC family protein [Bacteroidetes bacterium]|nr:OsmC family protein [Bacteroidota bacterium]